MAEEVTELEQELTLDAIFSFLAAKEIEMDEEGTKIFKKPSLIFEDVKGLISEIDFTSGMSKNARYTKSILKKEIERAKKCSLTRILLEGKEIKELPDEIGSLVTLKEISLRNNLLEKLPKTFSSLKYVEKIDLTANFFVSFPLIICETP